MRHAWIFLLLAAWAAAQPAHPDAQPVSPYRIAGNLWYAGTNDITSYMVTTPAGHIVINAGYEETAALISASIEKLGFRPRDVRILLNSQAHFDHVAGTAALQNLTGAKVYSSVADAEVMESGGARDFRWGKEFTYPPVKVERQLADGDRVTLGGVTLVAHVTGGHSAGCTTWTLEVEEGGRRYHMVIVGETTINPGVTLVNNAAYPNMVQDFERAFKVLKALQCDIFLGAHGGYYGMAEKYERMKRGEQPNPFIDPKGYFQYVVRAEKRFLEQLARERGAP